MAARASTRVSIAWSGAAAEEDTDTLVLTIEGFSLDLRVFNRGEGEGTIDWSTVAHVGEVEGSTPENPILRWDHIIDSRPPSDLPDQGVFHTLPNGDVTETGTMYNPKTKLNEAYVETWRRLPLKPHTPYFVLRRDSSARVDGVEGVAYIGRVGSNALGLGKTEDGQFYAWREKLEGETWIRTYAFGEDTKLAAWLPSTNLPQSLPEHWKQGNAVELDNVNWIIEAIGVV